TPVRIRPNAYDGEPLGGRVTFVGRAVDPQSRTFPIEVALSNVEAPLRPEMVVSLQVSRAVLEDVIALPLGAILRDERGPSVFVAREDTTGLVARYQPVELGPTSGGRVVVTAGLEPGDRVLVAGQTTVADGDRIRIAEQHAGQVLPTALTDRAPPCVSRRASPHPYAPRTTSHAMKINNLAIQNRVAVVVLTVLLSIIG